MWPYNIKFAQELSERAFEPRQVIAGKDARTLAAEVLAMGDEQFRTAFKKSPIKRAKRSGLVRNVDVVLGNIGVPDDANVPADAIHDPDPLTREYAEVTL